MKLNAKEYEVLQSAIDYLEGLLNNAIDDEDYLYAETIGSTIDKLKDAMCEE